MDHIEFIAGSMRQRTGTKKMTDWHFDEAAIKRALAHFANRHHMKARFDPQDVDIIVWTDQSEGPRKPIEAIARERKT